MIIEFMENEINITMIKAKDDNLLMYGSDVSHKIQEMFPNFFNENRDLIGMGIIKIYYDGHSLKGGMIVNIENGQCISFVSPKEIEVNQHYNHWE